MDLQIFSEDDIPKQRSSSLRKGIRSLKKVIEIHKAKIANPKAFYPDWDSFDEREQLGNIRHWRKEIANSEESIQNRIEELQKRGEHI